MTIDVTKEKLGVVIGTYIKLRDKKAEVAKRHKEELGEINGAMDNIEGAVLEYLNAEQLTRVGTDEGMAYTKDYTSAKVEDKQTFLQFCQDHDLFALMEIKASAKTVEEYMETESALPPGVNFSRYTKVIFNRG